MIEGFGRRKVKPSFNIGSNGSTDVDDTAHEMVFNHATVYNIPSYNYPSSLDYIPFWLAIQT